MFTKEQMVFDFAPNFKKIGADGKDRDTVVSLTQPDFLVNSHGFVLNDISALTAAQSAQEAELLLKRIQLYQANNPDTSGMSITDLIRTVSPRSAQCPSEVARAAEFIAQHIQEKVDSKVSAKVAQEQAKAAKEAQYKQTKVEYSEPTPTK